jgi:hypothetical protein
MSFMIINSRLLAWRIAPKAHWLPANLLIPRTRSLLKTLFKW